MMKAAAMVAEPPKPEPAVAAPGRAASAPKRRMVGRIGGRRVQMALTGVLIVAGVAAWAVALVQPWGRRTGDPGLVMVPVAELDLERIRSASASEDWMPQKKKAPLRELKRNPFLPDMGAAEAAPAPTHAEESAGLPRAASPGRAAGVLATVKAFRLEVTLMTPGGERWAVINGKDCREGDSVNGMKLIEIQEGKVKLEQDGIICMLRMD